MQRSKPPHKQRKTINNGKSVLPHLLPHSFKKKNNTLFVTMSSFSVPLQVTSIYTELLICQTVCSTTISVLKRSLLLYSGEHITAWITAWLEDGQSPGTSRKDRGKDLREAPALFQSMQDSSKWLSINRKRLFQCKADGVTKPYLRNHTTGSSK